VGGVGPRRRHHPQLLFGFLEPRRDRGCRGQLSYCQWFRPPLGTYPGCSMVHKWVGFLTWLFLTGPDIMYRKCSGRLCRNTVTVVPRHEQGHASQSPKSVAVNGLSCETFHKQGHEGGVDGRV
jgi:hypothetical protein